MAVIRNSFHRILYKGKLPHADKTNMSWPNNTEKQTSPPLDKQKKLEVFNDAIKCSLCLEILHDPVSAMPCLHNFCRFCFQQHIWFKEKKCAICRKGVWSYGHNFQLQEVISIFLEDHPEFKRCEGDLLEIQKGSMEWEESEKRKNEGLSEESACIKRARFGIDFILSDLCSKLVQNISDVARREEALNYVSILIKNLSSVVFFNMFTDREAIKAIANAIGVCSSVVEFEFGEVANLGDDEMKIIVELGLKKNFSINILKIGGGMITDAGIGTLRSVLSPMSNIHTLVISHNKLGNGSAYHIGCALSDNFTLKHLDITYNFIEDAGVVYLSDCLRNNKSVETLKLNGNRRITTKGFCSLAVVLNENSVLTDLGVGGNRFWRLKNEEVHDATYAMSEALLNSNNLQTLDMQTNSTTIRGIKNLSYALSFNQSLTSLNLSASGLQDNDIRILTEKITQNKTLKILKLNRNFISCPGATCISNMLLVNRGLSEIYVSETEIADEGAIAFAVALKKNGKMLCLELDRTFVADRGIFGLANALTANISLKNLSLSSTNITSAGCTAIADALKTNTVLKSLDISDNRVMNRGAIALASALFQNKSLIELFLCGDIDLYERNDLLGDAAGAVFCNLLSVNHCLQRLDLRFNEFTLTQKEDMMEIWNASRNNEHGLTV